MYVYSGCIEKKSVNGSCFSSERCDQTVTKSSEFGKGYTMHGVQATKIDSAFPFYGVMMCNELCQSVATALKLGQNKSTDGCLKFPPEKRFIHLHHVRVERTTSYV